MFILWKKVIFIVFIDEHHNNCTSFASCVHLAVRLLSQFSHLFVLKPSVNVMPWWSVSAGLRYHILHRVSKNVPPLTCKQSWHTHFDYDNFGTSVTEKVGNQKVLYLPTSPNLCLCTTWGNRKPENCTFSLKCCMRFTKNTRNTLKYHLVTAEPLFTVKTIDRMHQTGPRILLSVAQYSHTLC